MAKNDKIREVQTGQYVAPITKMDDSLLPAFEKLVKKALTTPPPAKKDKKKK